MELEVLAEIQYLGKYSQYFLLCSDNNLYWPNRGYRSYIEPFKPNSIGLKCGLTYEAIKPFSITEYKDGTRVRGDKIGK